jgi:hypothetical protein
VGNFVAGKHDNGDGAALAYYFAKGGKWCIDDCAELSTQFAIVAGAFSSVPESQSVWAKPCGTDRAACKRMVAPALVALEIERTRQLAEAERVKARKEADAIAAVAREKAQKEAAVLAEQKRIADEKQRVIDDRNRFLATASAAQLSVDADDLETKKDFVQAAVVYGIVVKRFPDSPYASQAMIRRAAMRDKRDQQEADAKKAAADAEIRREDMAARKAEADARAAQTLALANAQAASQSNSGGTVVGSVASSVACHACGQLPFPADAACRAVSCK